MDRHNTKSAGVYPYERREDEELMTGYIAGDEAAFYELYRRYRPRAYGFFSKRVRERTVVDELFQLAFLKLHRSRERYQPGRLFSAWFFTICRNVVIDYFRQQGRLPEIVNTEAAIENASAAESIRTDSALPTELLETLSANQREAVRLRYEEELDFEEIAHELRTSQENVRQLISRGMKKIRGLLKGNGNE